MEKPGILPGRFRRLQWRLTLSYTLVTVAALVVVELALVALLVIVLNSDFLTEEIVAVVEDSIVPRASKYLASSPPDIDGLNAWLQTVIDDSVAKDGEGRRITRGHIQFERDYQLYVVDADGLLLAQALEGHSPSPTGEPFEATVIPNLDPLLTAVLKGDGPVERFFATAPEDNLVMALPIEDQGGDLLGVFVVEIPLPVFNLRTLGSIALIIAISVIPITLAAGLIGTVFGFLTARGLTRRLESLSHAADAWSQGDFSVLAADTSTDELGQLSHRLNLMAEQLQNLLHSHQQLAGIQERNRLARELHDSVKQQVFATTMQFGAAKALLPGDPDEALRHLVEAEKLSRQSQEELATLIQEMRPPALENDGLAEALKNYTVDWTRQTGIQTQVLVQDKRPIPLNMEQTLFRLAQEALSNIARHSAASTVEIRLDFEIGIVKLSVDDDGRGFDPSQAKKQGIGLQTMRERVENMGGRLVIDSKLGQGTRITARLPIIIEGF